jgi:hypothetical protein
MKRSLLRSDFEMLAFGVRPILEHEAKIIEDVSVYRRSGAE